MSFFKDDSKVSKFLSKTRREAHPRATSAIPDSYDRIISALHQLHIDTTEKGETRNQATNILNKMEEFEFTVMLYLGGYLLDEFHQNSRSLRDPKMNLDVCRKLCASLLDFFKGSRDLVEEQAKEKLSDVDCKKSRSRRRHIDGEDSRDLFEEQAKKKLPDVDCKKSRSRRRHIGDIDEDDDALENLEPRDKFRIKAFITCDGCIKSQIWHKRHQYTMMLQKCFQP